MDEPAKQKNTSRSYLTTAIILLIILFFFLMIIIQMQRNYQTSIYIKQTQLENEIAEIENENLALQQRYYSSSEFAEISARQMNKALPGENLVILGETSREIENEESTVNSTTARSNFDKWFAFLSGRR